MTVTGISRYGSRAVRVRYRGESVRGRQERGRRDGAPRGQSHAVLNTVPVRSRTDRQKFATFCSRAMRQARPGTRRPRDGPFRPHRRHRRPLSRILPHRSPFRRSPSTPLVQPNIPGDRKVIWLGTCLKRAMGSSLAHFRHRETYRQGVFAIRQSTTDRVASRKSRRRCAVQAPRAQPARTVRVECMYRKLLEVAHVRAMRREQRLSAPASAAGCNCESSRVSPSDAIEAARSP